MSNVSKIAAIVAGLAELLKTGEESSQIAPALVLQFAAQSLQAHSETAQALEAIDAGTIAAATDAAGALAVEVGSLSKGVGELARVAAQAKADAEDAMAQLEAVRADLAGLRADMEPKA